MHDAERFPHYVEVAAGCFSGPFAPTISKHKTLRAALDKARKSDRLVAVNGITGDRYQIPRQDHPSLGAGSYGNGISREQARALGWPL